jgi:hypothetical protein
MSDEPERPEELVSRDDARALVGEMIFGSDLISGLTEEQQKLYNSEFGPKKRKRPTQRRGSASPSTFLRSHARLSIVRSSISS